MFQGEEWLKNQDLVDKLRLIAAEAGKSVAQLVIQWTISQPGITVALCGARRPDQVHDNAGGADWALTAEQRRQVDQALRERGTPATKSAVA